MKKTVSKYGNGGGTKRRSTTVKVVKDTPNKISAVSTTTVNRKSGAPKKVVSKSYENNFDAKGQVIGGSDVLKIEKSKYDRSGKLKSTVTKGASTFQKGGATGAQMKAKGMAMKAKGQDLKRAVTKRMQMGGVSGNDNMTTNTTQGQRLNMPAPTSSVDNSNTNTTQGQSLNGYKKGGSKMKIGAPKPGSAKPGSKRSKGY